MKRFKGLLVAAVLMILGASVFAAEATVTYVSGKVEVQRGVIFSPNDLCHRLFLFTRHTYKPSVVALYES